MRQLLMDALVFPRNYIRASLSLNNCIHSGNYQVGEQACESCLQKDACHWLYSNDECSNPHRKSTPELLQSLEFSLDFIDTDAAHMGHNIGTCSCHTCLWLKNAENLLSLYQKVKRSAHLEIAARNF